MANQNQPGQAQPGQKQSGQMQRSQGGRGEVTRGGGRGDLQRAVELPVRVAPPVDIFESDDEILLVAEMPGANRETLDLRFSENTLTLHCTRELQMGEGFVSAELRPVQYHRSFLVPQSIDASRISAELKSGVLKVHLPKAEQHKPRQIKVEMG